MQKITRTIVTITIFFFIILFSFSTQTIGKIGIQGGIPAGMTESELQEMQMQVFSEFAQAYKNFSPEEKTEFCKQAGMPIEEVEKFVNEIEETIVSSQNKSLYQPQQYTPSLSSNQPTTSPIGQAPKAEKDKSESSEEEGKKKNYECLSDIRKSQKIIHNILLNFYDKQLRKKALDANPNTLVDLETTNYYLGAIAHYINLLNEKNNATKIEPQDLAILKTIAELIIQKLNDPLQGMTAQQSDESMPNKSLSALYKRYHVRARNKDTLIGKINHKIEETKIKIDNIKNSGLDEKTKKKLTREASFTIDSLYQDLADAEGENFEQDGEQEFRNAQKKREFKLSNAHLIGEAIHQLVEESKIIQQIEAFFKKYFPKDLADGKERLELVKKRAAEEQKIALQKSSSGEIETEKIRSSSYHEASRNSHTRDDDFEQFSQSFSNNDYQYENSQNNYDDRESEKGMGADIPENSSHKGSSGEGEDTNEKKGSKLKKDRYRNYPKIPEPTDQDTIDTKIDTKKESKKTKKGEKIEAEFTPLQILFSSVTEMLRLRKKLSETTESNKESDTKQEINQEQSNNNQNDHQATESNSNEQSNEAQVTNNNQVASENAYNISFERVLAAIDNLKNESDFVNIVTEKDEKKENENEKEEKNNQKTENTQKNNQSNDDSKDNSANKEQFSLLVQIFTELTIASKTYKDDKHIAACITKLEEQVKIVFSNISTDNKVDNSDANEKNKNKTRADTLLDYIHQELKNNGFDDQSNPPSPNNSTQKASNQQNMNDSEYFDNDGGG